MALLAFDFRVTAAAAAGVFAVLTVAQLLALPRHRAEPAAQPSSVLDDWRSVVANRGFLLFALAMIGSYVLSFQVYLALPLQAAVLRPGNETALVAAVFVVSGLIAVGGQLRITRWFSDRWGPRRSLVVGLLVLAAAFVPLAVVPDGDRFGTAAAVAALLVSSALLALGSAAVFPFEMDTVVALSGDRLVATHYGFYNTVVGVGILAGNVATGSLIGAARAAGLAELVWLGLTAIGLVSAAALYLLMRDGGKLAPSTPLTASEP
ncbi:major facilitator superfamily transporter [Mycolicibacterium farcinogenes]|uniref:Major facilitator superfamily protein n=2 Tax=Mycolicibacterium senegalense TaxID=1796 RepID=A0A378SXT4_9MYCO|nr:major facilitator superfamily transporter [Mycolicibacterium farcinogenes]STZ53329.1 major facilitator superfamily protein [Mycolicibacterium senegalense]